VATTKREQTKRPLHSRTGAKENTVANRHRLLADQVDFVAGSIFLFENRDPDGDLLDGESPELSEAEQSARFVNKFSRRLRGLFHDLRDEELVAEDELPLFYWPQTAEARIRLAMRLREVARTVLSEI
jgi:hypothetical protein